MVGSDETLGGRQQRWKEGGRNVPMNKLTHVRIGKFELRDVMHCDWQANIDLVFRTVGS